MWPGFDSRSRRPAYVGWVCCWFSSLLRGIFSDSGFPPFIKTNIVNSNSIWIIVKHIIMSHRLGRLRKHSRVSPYSDCTSPRPSHSESSPMLTPYSDIASSSSDCGSEPDEVLTHYEEPPKKKRPRTTFSRNEVLELEQAFRRRPCLIGDDDEKLGQRLGIPAKSVKVS